MTTEKTAEKTLEQLNQDFSIPDQVKVVGVHIVDGLVGAAADAPVIAIAVAVVFAFTNHWHC